MKRYLHAFGMCQSMFCAIPSPYQGWDEDARPLMLLFLPLVGLEMGWVLGGMKESAGEYIRDMAVLFHDNLRMTLERAAIKR